MKLHLNPAGGRNVFNGYGDGFVLVSGVRHETGVLVEPEGEVAGWEVRDIADLDERQVARLAGLRVEILLLGTGKVLRFPPAHVLQPLAQAGIGVEVMDTPAACRTYNFLMAEGRKVAAALML
jgi:uncharacterized protein